MIMLIGDSPYPDKNQWYMSKDPKYGTDPVAFLTAKAPKPTSHSLENLCLALNITVNINKPNDVFEYFNSKDVLLFNAFENKNDLHLSKTFIHKVKFYGPICSTFVIVGEHALSAVGLISEFSRCNSKIYVIPHPGHNTTIFNNWLKGKADERFTTKIYLNQHVQI